MEGASHDSKYASLVVIGRSVDKRKGDQVRQFVYYTSTIAFKPHGSVCMGKCRHVFVPEGWNIEGP
jgi:hypothetical protein